jgi:hypothetical protein
MEEEIAKKMKLDLNLNSIPKMSKQELKSFEKLILDPSSKETEFNDELINLSGYEEYLKEKPVEIKKTKIEQLLGDKFSQLGDFNSIKVTEPSLHSIEELSNAKNLEFLTITGTQIQSIEPLQNCLKLKAVWIMNNKIQDLSPLSELKNLVNLCLSNTQVFSVHPLKNITSLKNLWLNKTKIDNVVGLSNLVNLESLDLSHTNVYDITPLSNLKELISLNLTLTNVQEIETISNFKKLKIISVSGTGVNLHKYIHVFDSLNCKIMTEFGEFSTETFRHPEKFFNIYNERETIQMKIQTSLEMIQSQLKKVNWSSSISNLLTELISGITSIWFETFENINSVLSSSLIPPASDLQFYFSQQHFIFQYGLNTIRYCIYLLFKQSDDDKVRQYYTIEFKNFDFNQKIEDLLERHPGTISPKEWLTKFVYWYTRTDVLEIYLKKLVQWHFFSPELKRDIYKASILCELIYTYPKTIQWDSNNFIEIKTIKEIIQTKMLYDKNFKNLEEILISEMKENSLVQDGIFQNAKYQDKEAEEHFLEELKKKKNLLGSDFPNIDFEDCYTFQSLKTELVENFIDLNKKYHDLVEDSGDNITLHKFLNINVDNIHITLTHKFGITGQFLERVNALKLVQGLEQFQNIKYSNIEYIGFRHHFKNGDFSTKVKEFLVKPIKGNNYSSFDKGELDFIMMSIEEIDSVEIWFIFSGSNSSSDWAQNLTLSFTKTTDGHEIHSGHQNIWDTYTEMNIKAALNSLGDKFKGKNIKFIVCGHSLGASLAILCGQYLKKTRKDTVQVISIGGPPILHVESPKFDIDDCLISVINPEDPIVTFKHFFYFFERKSSGILLPLEDHSIESFVNKNFWIDDQKHDINRYCSLIKHLFLNNFPQK